MKRDRQTGSVYWSAISGYTKYYMRHYRGDHRRQERDRLELCEDYMTLTLKHDGRLEIPGFQVQKTCSACSQAQRAIPATGLIFGRTKTYMTIDHWHNKPPTGIVATRKKTLC